MGKVYYKSKANFCLPNLTEKVQFIEYSNEKHTVR